jgi:hypothetical protein
MPRWRWATCRSATQPKPLPSAAPHRHFRVLVGRSRTIVVNLWGRGRPLQTCHVVSGQNSSSRYRSPMAFQAHVLKVLIASPGDTAVERDAVDASIHGWNASRAEVVQTVLMPWRWERHAVPVLGQSAQSVINSQAVDQADIVVALFDSRLGEATQVALSGTVEEIERAHAAGKPVHVYFSTAPLPRDVDVEQFARLQDFRADLEKIGLLGAYASPEDLAYQVRQAIEHDLQALRLGSATGPKRQAGARLRAHFKEERSPNGFDRRGKAKFRTTQRLVLRNDGEAAAEAVQVEVAMPLDLPQGAGYRWGGSTPEKPFDLLPGAEREWPFLPLGLSEVTVRTRWSEGEHHLTEEQTISL